MVLRALAIGTRHRRPDAAGASQAVEDLQAGST